MWREMTLVALRSIRGQALRTTLTIGIIGMGIMALIAMVTATESLKANVTQEFSSLGTQSFSIDRFERKDFIAPFWTVLADTTDDEKTANCELTTRDVKYKGVWIGARNTNPETIISIPVIQNTKDIKQHEILRLYKKKAEKREAPDKKDAFSLNTKFESRAMAAKKAKVA